MFFDITSTLTGTFSRSLGGFSFPGVKTGAFCTGVYTGPNFTGVNTGPFCTGVSAHRLVVGVGEGALCKTIVCSCAFGLGALFTGKLAEVNLVVGKLVAG